MRTFSTCADCGLLLEVVDAHATHPACTEPADPEAPLVTGYLDALGRGDDVEADKFASVLNRRRPPQLLAAALVYAGWGWPVFPLIPGGKVPMTKHGFKNASADLGRIREWWARAPQANIGLPTGHGFDVVDVDAPLGWRAHGELVTSGTIPEVHGIVSTAGSGLHLYVRPTGGGNLAGIRPGIDYRGVGGYVVAPPSVDGRGHPYVWRIKPSPLITTPSEEGGPSE